MVDFQAGVFEKIAYKLHLYSLSDRFRKKRISQMIDSFSKSLTPDDNAYLRNTSTLNTEDPVFVFWAQGETAMPPVVRACYESVKRMCGSNRVVFLHMNNLRDWVSLPSFLFSRLERGALSLTHFSDILRFCLLERYGGWWLDATVFLSNPLPSEKGFFSVKSLPNNTYVSKGRWTGFIWHMPKGYPLAIYMKQFLLSWWSQPNASLPDYFFIDYCIRWFYRNNTSFQKQIDDLPVSNPDMYFFQSSLCDSQFDLEEWKRISKGTTFFKTTYKNPFPATPGSYRSVLLIPYD